MANQKQKYLSHVYVYILRYLNKKSACVRVDNKVDVNLPELFRRGTTTFVAMRVRLFHSGLRRQIPITTL